jgi:hypothetical protein
MNDLRGPKRIASLFRPNSIGVRLGTKRSFLVSGLKQARAERLNGQLPLELAFRDDQYCLALASGSVCL